MDLTPLPINDIGNGAHLRTLTFHEADALMLARAMMIASNTAMMSQGKVAVRRLNFYREQFLLLVPEAAKALRRDTDIAEIVIAMETAPSWTVQFQLERWSTTKGHSVVSVGAKAWGTRDKVSKEMHDAIIAMIAELAPVSCAYEPSADVEGERW